MGALASNSANGAHASVHHLTSFYGGSVYSTDKPNSDHNTGIRVYGDWYHKHTETGKEVSHKGMALVWFNEAGKIYEFRDFFDVNGFLKQHTQ